MITKVLGSKIFCTQALQCQLNFLLQPSEKIICRFLLKKKKKKLTPVLQILTSSAFPELLFETLLWPNNSQNTAEQCVTEVIL